jgi:isopenicillin N synthase-like dioxygenase
MGLLTILPALSSGLELKTFQYPYQYLDVEALAPQKPCLIIFAAEGLSRLTSGYFQAPIHRVVSTSFRYSMPFFFRSNSKEKIDLNSLQSMKLNQMIENGQLESLEGITAFDLEVLVQVQYKQKRIPAELGAYKQIPYYRQLFD